jgi:predicted metal-binding protein
VLVCRGCCCGTERKHPDVDHDAQVEALRAVARVRIVDCVGECSQSNVVIVRPGDGRTLWFGRILGEASTSTLCSWLADGAAADVPDRLARLRFDRGVAATSVTTVFPGR